MAQVVDRGYPVSEVAERLGVIAKSLYTWKAPFAQPTKERAAELRRLKKELIRVTDERDTLKMAAAYFARESR